MLTELGARSLELIDSARSNRVSIATGAVRSGKTVTANLVFLSLLAQAPPTGRILIMGKTTQTVYRNVISVMKDEALYGALARQVHYTPGAPSAYILGREVDIVGANDVRAEERIRGMTLGLALVDEVTNIPSNVYKQLLARMSVRGARLICTCNPDSPYHWLKRDYIDKPETNTAVTHFTMDDNASLDPKYVEWLKSQYDGVFYDRLIRGLWVQAEGAVYPGFDRSLHVAEIDTPPVTPMLVACDVGQMNAFVALEASVRLYRGRKVLYVSRELRHSGRETQRILGDAEYVQMLGDFLDDDTRGVAVDPSAKGFVAAAHRGRVGGKVAKAHNSVLDGIRCVSGVINAGDLIISPDCEHLLAEISNYVWDEEASKRGEDKPMKVEDDCVDALRYLVYTYRKQWRKHVTSVQTGGDDG